jgi:bacterioferritin
MITKEELIKEINVDIAYEFAAAIQYVQHAACMTGAEYQSIQKELIVHATEEMGHANVLAEQVSYLGGVPAVDVEERLIDPSSKTMLEQDLAGEQLAVQRYRERIEQAQSLKLYGLEMALKNILVDEEEHERDLQEALGM